MKRRSDSSKQENGRVKEEDDYESVDGSDEYSSMETRRRKQSKKKKSRNGKDENGSSSGDSNSPSYSSRDLNMRNTNGKLEVAERKSMTIGPILYQPGEALELEQHIGNFVCFYVLPKHLTLQNDQVRGRQIWGCGSYTGDSDVVCMLQHSGIFTLANTEPDFCALKVVLKILPGESLYDGSESNGLKSKAWQSHSVSLYPEEVEIVRDKEVIAPLLLDIKSEDAIQKEKVSKQSRAKHRNRGRAKTTNTEISHFDEDISVNIFKDTLLLFNLSNDICFQYNLNLICDRGVDEKLWTSFRLRTSSLMLECDNIRYELSQIGSLGEGSKVFDAYRWAKVNNPQQQSREWFKSNSCPLDKEHVNILCDGLDWSQFEWDTNGVKIGGVDYTIKKLFWVKRHSKDCTETAMPLE